MGNHARLTVESIRRFQRRFLNVRVYLFLLALVSLYSFVKGQYPEILRLHLIANGTKRGVLASLALGCDNLIEMLP